MASVLEALTAAVQYHKTGRWLAAEQIYRKVLEVEPTQADALHLLGVVCGQLGKLEEGADYLAQAVRVQGNQAPFHTDLGDALCALGRIGEAVSCYRRALAVKPDFALAHSNLLFAMHFSQDYSAEQILEESKAFDRQHAQPLPRFRPTGSCGHRLRIGYVSPYFRNHCQSYFTIPLLANHNHKDFEVICYSDVGAPDEVTGRLQTYADTWRTTTELTDAELADLIHEDRIDILVDLTMHMGRNRLLAFARKPAPVQVCWLAYPGTTGLEAMDYRLTDPFLDPVGASDHNYVEQSIRLPECFWCYEPLSADVDVNPLPALQNGYPTFGCFNNFCKLNAGTLSLWAKVLKAVERSRLLLLSPEGTCRRNVLHLLEQEGISGERITFVARQSGRAYFELYHQVDLMLETLPYNGHTTTIDAAWMGVPVITLAGPTVVGRGGFSLLSNLELRPFIAGSVQEYVSITAELSRDPAQLSALRVQLRRWLEESPIMDAPRFAKAVETAYRSMWERVHKKS
jgi:protein O-GlcNAc transferase